MAAIHINLLGRMAVFVDDRPRFIGLPHTKPLELFAYLLVHRQRTHPREVVATHLWPDRFSARARKNLRKVLCMLQQFLVDTVGSDAPPPLLIAHDWIAINPAIDLQLDVAVFEQTYALAQPHAGGALDPQRGQTLMATVALYEGELLAGLYADWCLPERERFENMYLELRHRLLVHAEQQRAYSQAIEHGLAILRYNRANERTSCDLMRLYYRSGNRSAALHQYARCVTALAAELGVRPGADTAALYRQICRDELTSAGAEPDSGLALQRELGADAGARRELQRMLEQVQDEIQHIDRLLQE
jgi:DNA-binding SARP family transcriptional activator